MQPLPGISMLHRERLLAYERPLPAPGTATQRDHYVCLGRLTPPSGPWLPHGESFVQRLGSEWEQYSRLITFGGGRRPCLRQSSFCGAEMSGPGVLGLPVRALPRYYHTVLGWGVDVVTMNIKALCSYLVIHIISLYFYGGYCNIPTNVIFILIHIFKYK